MKAFKTLVKNSNMDNNSFGRVTEVVSFKGKLIFQIVWVVANGTSALEAYIMDKQGCKQFIANDKNIITSKNGYRFCSYVADASTKELCAEKGIKLMKEYLEAIYTEFLSLNN